MLRTHVFPLPYRSNRTARGKGAVERREDYGLLRQFRKRTTTRKICYRIFLLRPSMLLRVPSLSTTCVPTSGSNSPLPWQQRSIPLSMLAGTFSRQAEKSWQVIINKPVGVIIFIEMIHLCVQERGDEGDIRRLCR